MKEKIRLKEQINWIETSNRMENINKTKSWFFENIKGIHKHSNREIETQR
jgi:hypothetical protein